MPFVITPVDQPLASVGLFIDGVMSLTLEPSKTYLVEALLRWDQVDASSGGLQCSLATNLPPAAFSWTGTGETEDRVGGDPLVFFNSTGPRLVTMTGILTTGAMTLIVSVYRGLAQTSGNATNLRAYSVLQAGQVGQPFVPSNASMFLP